MSRDSTLFSATTLILFCGNIAFAQVTAFVDGRIVDGAGKVIERGTVVVRDGLIADVGPAASVRVPEGAVRVDARGKTLMPGIVNAHGHLSGAKALAEAGTPFIAHSVRDLPVDDAFLKAMKANDACYCPTLMREVSTFVYDRTPPWADDPFFRRGYGADVSAELRDPARHARIKASPAWAQGQKYMAGLEVAKGNLKRVAAAACWGKQGALGTIAKGAAADLLVLNANPLDSIVNTRAIDAIYIGGQRFDTPR